MIVDFGPVQQIVALRRPPAVGQIAAVVPDGAARIAYPAVWPE